MSKHSCQCKLQLWGKCTDLWDCWFWISVTDFCRSGTNSERWFFFLNLSIFICKILCNTAKCLLWLPHKSSDYLTSTTLMYFIFWFAMYKNSKSLQKRCKKDMSMAAFNVLCSKCSFENILPCPFCFYFCIKEEAVCRDCFFFVLQL